MEDIRKKLKPIVFLTSGTRGDVQPITALAHGLQSAGHAVRVAAPPSFRKLVESQFVPFTALEGNPSDLLTEPGRQSALTFNDNLFSGAKSAMGYLRAAQPVYAQMLESGWNVAQDASALVIGPPTIWGTSIAQALGIPCIGAFLQPVTSTGDFPSPLLPSTLRLGRAYNKFTYWLMSQAVYLPWRGVINQWRSRSLGLGGLPVFYPSFGKMDMVIYGFSEKVVPYPGDWPPSHFITGYWPIKTENYLPPIELKAFLGAGEAPFYFGFGSPGMHEPGALVSLLIGAIIKTNTRAIISLPSNMDLPIQNGNIFLLREHVPHHWLFPQMAGTIHHGGAGTTAEALKAGVPSLIAPLAVDQFFWGEHVHSLGVSPRAIPQRALTTEKLVGALEEMKNKKMKDAARKLGDQLRAEDGVANAVGVIKNFLETRAG